MKVTAVNNDLLQAAVAALPADALTSMRQSAVDQFVHDGFPTPRHEDWKYTNLSEVANLSNTWLDGPVVAEKTDRLPSAAKTQLEGLTSSIDAHWLAVSGGVAVPVDDNVDLPQGLQISRLSDDMPDRGLIADDSMTRFNAALLHDGIRIRVRAGTVVEKPIGFLIIDDSSHDPSVSQARLVVEVEENARVKVIQSYWSSGESAQFANAVTEIDLANGAQADIVQLQECSDEHMLISTLLARQHQDSQFNYNSFDLGGALTRNDVKVDIVGSGADANLHGLYMAGDGQHIDNHTRIDHRVGPARSREIYRGILGHGSRCVFNGKAVIHTGADGSDASQENHNLLLSGHAEIDTKPELEIYADDVKCSHGATVGQLDKAALFYLRTRGLSRDEAAIVLTRAFASSILAGLAIEACRDYVSQRIDQRLDRMISDSPEQSELRL